MARCARRWPSDGRLFNAGKTAIAWYIGTQGLELTYAAAASVVVLLVWVYYSAQILLFGWAKEFRERRPDVPVATIERYLHNLFRVRPDFVFSVSRDFARNCQTPVLVLPDNTPAHANQTCVDIASLAPNAEVTVYPWKEPPELKDRTVNRVRKFLEAHVPASVTR